MKRVVASALLVLGAAPGFAQVVDSLEDPDPSVDGTLRFEIDNAGPGDVIDVQVGAPDAVETISLRETLVFTQDLEIDNSSVDTGVIDVLAPAGSAFLEIQDGVNVTLRDVGLSGLDSTSGDDIELGTGSLLTLDSERIQQVLTMDIVGMGALRKEGIQQIQLTGINTFEGGLTIDDGDVVGEVRSLGAGTIDLAPDASSKTARLVFESSGTDILGATGPVIADSRSGGGNAGIVKRGSGTLVVTNATIASTLDFDIEEGTLRAGATQLLNGHDFDVGPTATLELDAVAGTVASSAVLTGTGTIDVEADDLTFTADPSGFTGTFDVNDGPGAGAGDGALVLDIAATPAASLRFDATADGATFTLRDAVGVRWSGDFSGTGVFVKAGAGTTTLTGTHSQTGETRVLAGTLVGNTSNLPGDIALAGGAAVVFDQASNATYADTIRNFSAGAHTVRKLGGGVLTLAGDQTFTGTFEAIRGGLHFAHGADLTGAGLTVGNGSSGVVTTVTADFDPTGTLDNTISVNGPITFSSDAHVTVGVSSPGSGGGALRSTVFAATGAVDIQPGAVLVVEPTTGTPSAGDQWDVVTGAAVTGAFDIEQTLLFFVINQTIEGGNTVRLTLAPSGAMLETEATTSNGRVIGAQLDEFLGETFAPMSREEEYQQAITGIGVADVDGLLESVSPDDLAAGTQIQLANAQRTWRGISDRLALRRIGGVGRDEGSPRPRRTRPSVSASPTSRAAGPDGERPPREEADWQAWIEASGLFGELSSNEAREYDYVSAGPLVGADRALGEAVRLGFALSGGSYAYDTSEGDNEGDGGGVEGTVYGAYVGEPVEVLVGARAGWSRIDTERTLSVGSISDRVDGELEGEVYGVFVELTRGFDLPGAVEIAPLASLAWTGVRWDAFDESGSSPLAVRVEEQEIDSILTSLGVRLQGERRMDENIWFRPRFRALWSREWGDTEREVSGAFASAPAAGLGAFTVDGAEGPTDLGEIALGWDVGFTTNANLFFDWRGRFGDDLVENTISAGGRIVW
ncbi:MAG: autotransporter domain-containing protein [bacterium]|nr:autotransporter domain-containing protein [bacterium]